METDKERSKMITALREIANTLEKNPNLPLPYFGSVVKRVDNASQMLSYARTYGGKWDKSTDATDYNLRRKLADGLTLVVYASRESVCHRTVTGVKEIPARIVPARAEEIIPAHTEEIVEWLCPESLSAIGEEKKEATENTIEEPTF